MSNIENNLQEISSVSLYLELSQILLLYLLLVNDKLGPKDCMKKSTQWLNVYQHIC